MRWRGRPGRGGQRCQGRRGDPLAGGPSRGPRPPPPPRGPVLLLPPKEGPLDNFHISSKFGDFRQCWEAWLGLPEAHVEVIKAERGSGGKEGWGKRGGGERPGRRAWEPGPCRPEKVVWNRSLPPGTVHGGDAHPTARGVGVQQGWMAAGSRGGAGARPAGQQRQRRCSLAWPEVSRDSHGFEKLHLAWEKKASRQHRGSAVSPG